MLSYCSAEITLPSIWPVEPLEDFWEEEKAYLCSGDLQIATSRQISLRKCFFIDSDISVAPIDPK